MRFLESLIRNWQSFSKAWHKYFPEPQLSPTQLSFLEGEKIIDSIIATVTTEFPELKISKFGSQNEKDNLTKGTVVINIVISDADYLSPVQFRDFAKKFMDLTALSSNDLNTGLGPYYKPVMRFSGGIMGSLDWDNVKIRPRNKHDKHDYSMNAEAIEIFQRVEQNLRENKDKIKALLVEMKQANQEAKQAFEISEAEGAAIGKGPGKVSVTLKSSAPPGRSAS